MLKKVVVVVGIVGDRLHKEFFEGEDLTARYQAGPTGEVLLYKAEPTLCIKDGETILAEFQGWMFWREMK